MIQKEIADCYFAARRAQDVAALLEVFDGAGMTALGPPIAASPV